MLHIDELTKDSNRARAAALLHECKKREKEEGYVMVRKDRQTVVLISKKKAKEQGLI